MDESKVEIIISNYDLFGNLELGIFEVTMFQMTDR